MDNTAEKILRYMKELLELYLGELNGLEYDVFVFGEKTAYVECLELIQTWEHARSAGLDYDIEKRFPISRRKEPGIAYGSQRISAEIVRSNA